MDTNEETTGLTQERKVSNESELCEDTTEGQEESEARNFGK